MSIFKKVFGGSTNEPSESDLNDIVKQIASIDKQLKAVVNKLDNFEKAINNNGETNE
jgi:DNA-binding FrmR family transcriptional regulator|tara:strand:+ start:483 stop:653 length:171 start_codon:yes stop_codon:yes gene_type:complete